MARRAKYLIRDFEVALFWRTAAVDRSPNAVGQTGALSARGRVGGATELAFRTAQGAFPRPAPGAVGPLRRAALPGDDLGRSVAGAARHKHIKAIIANALSVMSRLFASEALRLVARVTFEPTRFAVAEVRTRIAATAAPIFEVLQRRTGEVSE